VIAGFEYRGHDRDPSVFLFDIDTSGIIEVVGGGVHDDVEQAAQAWRTAVGDTAEDAVVEPVERSEDLMPLASRWRGRESISPPREGPASHSGWLGRRPGMFAAYLTITIVAAVVNGSAAVFYLIGHDYPKSMVDMKRLPRSWVPVLGSVLAAGSLGLLAGLAVPLLGTLAAGGLVLYFVGALAAHLRVGSRKLVGWAVFFAVAVATLSLNLVYNA
jgi:hypothetical protein